MNTLRTPTQAPLRLVATCAPQPCGRPATQPLLPVFHRPGRVALVAEDPGLVDALARAVPRRWRVRPFVSAARALYALQQEPPAWEADLWAQQRVIERWQAGAPLVPLLLSEWARTPERHALTTVAIADAYMAGIGGLDLLAELGELGTWPGARVLMAGAFDADTARQAFDDGTIDRYVVRRDHGLRADLVQVVDELLARPSPRHEALWAATLQPHQLELLGRPGVAGDLHALLQAHFVEWIVVGAPFGVLGLDAVGRAHWLQLESAAGLAALADRARAAGASAAAAQEVRLGRLLANVALRADLGLPGCDLLPARQVGGPGGLLAASTRIELTSEVPARGPARSCRHLRIPPFHPVLAVQ